MRYIFSVLFIVVLFVFKFFVFDANNFSEASSETTTNMGCYSKGNGTLDHLQSEDLERMCESIKDKDSCLRESVSRHDQPPEGGVKLKICEWKAKP